MSTSSYAPALLAALALSLPVLGAYAQPVEPGKEGVLATFVAPEKNSRACFRRQYDEAHLKDHAKQKVTEMEFRLAYYIHVPDDAFPKGQRNYYFELLAKLRGQKQAKPLTASGECTVADGGQQIFCGVECDGGGVTVKHAGDGRILVDLQSIGRLRMTLDCGEDEENSVELTPGADDKRFLLSRLLDAECPTYDNW